MCDTIALVRKDGVWFAKNSDRDANEAQRLEWVPRAEHPDGAKLKCTWIEIPQVRETNALMISRPYWMWGAEMGCNEHNVVIGNEAVFTKQPYAKTGLTGMDMVRLALERADTAEKACEVIEAMIAEHGQGGGCGHENRDFTYHNSFIVADPTSAFVLETAGKETAREQVDGVRTISNGLTIPGFAEKHSDTLRTRACSALGRHWRTQFLARKTRTERHLFSALRDHGQRYSNPKYRWINGSMVAPCMHAGGIIKSSQTTASWVTFIPRDGEPRHWATATAAPCTGLFKPISINHPLDLGAPEDTADDSLWWRHEAFHRLVLQDPEMVRDVFVPERNATEADWVENPVDPTEAFAKGDELLSKWTDAVRAKKPGDSRPFYVKRYWSKRNDKANISL
jgi:dipeptidase